MNWTQWLTFSILFISGCSHWSQRSDTTSKEDWPEGIRMAHAQMDTLSNPPVQGKVNFEQMPNSVIVTYYLEGLKPKSSYQLFLRPDQNCQTEDLKPNQMMFTLRANEKGISENTFKISSLKVAGENSLAKDSVVLRFLLAKSKVENRVNLACGDLKPHSSAELSQ